MNESALPAVGLPGEALLIATWKDRRMSVHEEVFLQQQTRSKTIEPDATLLKTLETIRSRLAVEVLTILKSISAADDRQAYDNRQPHTVSSHPPLVQTLLCAAVDDLQRVDDQLQDLRLNAKPLSPEISKDDD